MDYFKNFEDLLEAFKKYLSKTLPDGVCIIGWDNKNSQTIGYELQKPRLSFGRRIGSDIRLLSYEKTPGGLCFECMVDKLAVTCTLPLIGYHNMLNALCALAVAHAIGLDVKAAADSLASFRGVARRLETKYFSPQVKVFDDYAHNPGKVAACITGVREAYPAAKLHVIFQPHRYSRLETMYNEIVSAFLGADEVLILPVYAAGETAGADFSLELTGLDISKASNTSARLFKNFEECAEYAVNQVSDESIFLCLGAGDIWKLANTLGELFNAKQKKI
jgi:UDP-N-acetylmuramate--alanine ligase